MNETSTETSTDSVDGAPSPTAQEVASAYEQASDDGLSTPAPEDRPPDAPTPEAASSGTTTPPDSSVPAEVLSNTPIPSGPAPLPDNAIPNEDAPTSVPSPGGVPSSVAHPPGTLPVPRMNLQNNLRLRMKVWTDPSTLKRYLMPMAFMRDLINGQPITDVMYAHAISDDNTRVVMLTAGEWNALPFFYFQEDGYAPRAVARPMNTIP